MAMSAEHRAKICSPSPVMVTFPYECKILEWDDKHQTNKQTKINQLIQLTQILLARIQTRTILLASEFTHEKTWQRWPFIRYHVMTEYVINYSVIK